MIESVKEMKDNSLLVVSKKEGENTFYMIYNEDCEEVFKSDSFTCSPNLACFLGLTHAVSLVQEGDYNNHIYCNNMTSLIWLEKKSVNASGTDKKTNLELLDCIDFLESIDFEINSYHFSWKKNNKFKQLA